MTTRGYTGHEHLEEFDFIHMNGRVYDPTIGRFLSADPHIQDPYDSQSYNRYTYVKNNPLKYTDPSGFFFKKLFKKIKKWIKPIIAIAVGILTAGLGVAAYMSVFLNTAFSFSAGLIAVTSGVVGSIGFGAVVAAGAAMGFASGAIMTGSLSGALEGAAWGAIGGAISYGIGHGNGIFKSIRNAGGRDLMHGISRAVITRAQGGKFSAGFWSGFASSSLAPISESFNVYEARVVSNAIIGGTVSEISGGKFANGAVTGAFVYMFNHALEGNSIIDKTSKNFSDLFEGFISIPKVIYAYGDYLGRLSGFRDWQAGNILPGNKWEAQIEYKLTVYAAKNHPDKVMKVIWNDMKSRPYYYVGGSLTGVLSGSAATGVGVLIVHKAGSASDFVHTKVNPFH